MGDRLLVGTRGSRLALAQTKLVIERLEGAGAGVSFEVVPIKTAGDLSPPEARVGMDGKTAFTGEIERQLVDGKIDLAVHSMKDLPPASDERLVVAAMPPRGDPRDAFVSASKMSFGGLKNGARVGTSSARRRAQLMAARKDIEVVDLHGNVETRLRKLETENLDGVVLAAAGLERLGLGSRVTQLFGTGEMVPAPCQGILAVQARRDSVRVTTILGRIDDAATRTASECERAFSEALGGDCDVPLGAFARVNRGRIDGVGVLADPDGTRLVKISASSTLEGARELGRSLAAKVVASGGDEILRSLAR